MFDISKIIQIYIDDIENQIRKKDFPDRVHYLNKIRKIDQSHVSTVQSSFFEGIRLTFKAQRYQKINNISLIFSVILFFSYLAVNNLSKTYNVCVYEIPLDLILFIAFTLLFLTSVVISFLFAPLKNTIYKLFGEIDLYEPKVKTPPKTTTSKTKTNGKQ